MTTAVILSRDRKARDFPVIEATIEIANKRLANFDLEQWIFTHGDREREYSIWTYWQDWQHWLHRPGVDHRVVWDERNPI